MTSQKWCIVQHKIYEGTITESSSSYREYRDGKSRPARTCVYEKRIDNSHYFVVQTVANIKSGYQRIVSAFVSSTNYEDYMRNKKIEVTPVLDATIKSSPEATSKTGEVYPSIDNRINDSEGDDKSSALNG